MDSTHLLNCTEPHALNVDSLINTAKIAVKFQNCLLHTHPLLIRVFNFIETHYQDSISLKDVAEAVGRSRAYLTNVIRRDTGKTVLAWIIEYRMAEARRLLKETNQSVEQITQAVGYSDKRHFSRLFLRLHGTTPQVWRRMHQKSNFPFQQEYCQ
ncbi:hypothetical protein NUACC21_22380 [Scytonema sp. NUACC21]